MSRSEREKMLAHEPYDFAGSAELAAAMNRALRRLHRFNGEVPALTREENPAYFEALRALCPNAAESLYIRAPFQCDYGELIYGGAESFINNDCTFMDGGTITLGSRCFIGPRVQLYTATHPLDAARRATGEERALPVRIGDDCWLGGGAIVLPGVTIGDRSVVGAGAVVTRDVPPDSLVAGNPARVIRKLR